MLEMFIEFFEKINKYDTYFKNGHHVLIVFRSVHYTLTRLIAYFRNILNTYFIKCLACISFLYVSRNCSLCIKKS